MRRSQICTSGQPRLRFRGAAGRSGFHTEGGYGFPTPRWHFAHPVGLSALGPPSFARGADNEPSAWKRSA